MGKNKIKKELKKKFASNKDFITSIFEDVLKDFDLMKFKGVMNSIEFESDYGKVSVEREPSVQIENIEKESKKKPKNAKVETDKIPRKKSENIKNHESMKNVENTKVETDENFKKLENIKIVPDEVKSLFYSEGIKESTIYLKATQDGLRFNITGEDTLQLSPFEKENLYLRKFLFESRKYISHFEFAYKNRTVIIGLNCEFGWIRIRLYDKNSTIGQLISTLESLLYRDFKIDVPNEFCITDNNEKKSDVSFKINDRYIFKEMVEDLRTSLVK